MIQLAILIIILVVLIGRTLYIMYANNPKNYVLDILVLALTATIFIISIFVSMVYLVIESLKYLGVL